MRRMLISAVVCLALGAAFGLRLRPDGGAFDLGEAEQKAADAKVARLLAAKAEPLAAGWGLAHLPLAKIGEVASGQRRGRADLPPRLSLLLLGRPGQPQLALISAEVLAVPPRMAALLRAYAGEVLSLPQQRIVVIATHTHAGPRPAFGAALRFAFGEPELEEKPLAAAIAYAADEAKRGFAPARLGQASSRLSNYVANRSPGAQGAVDDRLRSLLLEKEGQRFLLWSYAAHPALVDRSAVEADGDYPARVAKMLEEVAGFDQVVFVPGRTAHAAMATERHPDRAAAVLANALEGLAQIAEHQLQPTAELGLEPFDLPALSPRLGASIVAAPWLQRWLGEGELSLQQIRLGPLRLTLVSGEVSNALVPSLSGEEWVVSMAGSGLGYLTAPEDAKRSPERPFVLLSEAELSRMGALLRRLSSGHQ